MKDKIEFGEVAMAPPTITAKPRKAETKDQRNDNLLLNSLIRGNEVAGDNKDKRKNNNNNGKDANKKSGPAAVKKAQKLKKLSALQKSNLLNERQRVVDKYRKLKSGNLAKL